MTQKDYQHCTAHSGKPRRAEAKSPETFVEPLNEKTRENSKQFKQFRLPGGNSSPSKPIAQSAGCVSARTAGRIQLQIETFRLEEKRGPPVKNARRREGRRARGAHARANRANKTARLISPPPSAPNRQQPVRSRLGENPSHAPMNQVNVSSNLRGAS